MKVYLVLHHEIVNWGGDVLVPDEMVFHTASSVAKALKYIKQSYVSEYSWWEIQEQVVNDTEWPEHVGWYGRKGGKLKRPPYEKAKKAFKKQRGH